MRPGAHYLRIVAEIRDRINRGELRPGDRVPSTREITREWGVAMATATRVIATLSEEGLVQPKSGAGTVVLAPVTAAAPHRPADPAQGRQADPAHRTGPVVVPMRPVERRQASAEPELTRDAVIRAAIALADAEGLATLSMRRVATELGVATMTLYRYVGGKEDLTLRMVDQVFGEEPLPADPTTGPDGWRARIEYAARTMWRVFRRHPWAAELMSMTRPQITPQLGRYAEWSLSALRDAGLGAADMMNTHLALFGHVRGTALSLGPEEQARQDTGLTSDEWMDTGAVDDQVAEVLAGGRYPTLRWIFTQPYDHDLDTVFEYGLRLILDGVEAGPARG